MITNGHPGKQYNHHLCFHFSLNGRIAHTVLAVHPIGLRPFMGIDAISHATSHNSLYRDIEK